MPQTAKKKSKGALARQPKSPYHLLRTCLEALLTDVNDPCLGTEYSCACCADGSSSPDVVDSICAFCLHSDAARSFFVSSGGGLEVLLLAVQSRLENTVSGALQVFQCLSVSHSTQQLILATQPQLLLSVAHMAAQGEGSNSSPAQDSEGLQHGALCLLTSWVQDTGSPFCAWALQQEPTNLESEAERSGSSPQQQQQKQPGSPLLLRVSSSALTHPSLVLRKAAARLFASVVAAAVATGPQQNTANLLMAACVRESSAVAQQVQALLDTELAPSSLPSFKAFAALGHTAADPFLVISLRSKATCQGLLHLTSELAQVPAHAGLQVLQQGHLACTALQLFCHAWGLLPPNATAPPSLGPSGRRSADVSSSQSGPSIDTNSSSKDDSKVIGQGSSNGSNISRTFPSRTAAGEDPGFHKQGAWAPAGSGPRYPAPLAFIQDHQSKEVALDALLGLVGCPGALGTLDQGHDAADTWHRLSEHQEESSLQVLLSVVKQMLQQQTAAHTRGALSILGHVHFRNGSHVQDPPPAPTKQGDDSSTGKFTKACARTEWMQLLSDVFDAAWSSEVAALQPHPQPLQPHTQPQYLLPPHDDSLAAAAAAPPIERVLYPPPQLPPRSSPPLQLPSEPSLILYPPPDNPQQPSLHLTAASARSSGDPPRVLYPPAASARAPPNPGAMPPPQGPSMGAGFGQGSGSSNVQGSSPAGTSFDSSGGSAHTAGGAGSSSRSSRARRRRGNGEAVYEGRAGVGAHMSNSSAAAQGGASSSAAAQGGAGSSAALNAGALGSSSSTGKLSSSSNAGSGPGRTALNTAARDPSIAAALGGTTGDLPSSSIGSTALPVTARDASKPGSTTAIKTGSIADERGGGAGVVADDRRPEGQGPGFEVGLGYRVLVQVLQAWKQLLDSRQSGVLSALHSTDWHARVRLAATHPKQLVVGAASKLLPFCDGLQLDAAEAQACTQQLVAMQGNAPGLAEVEWSNDAFAAALDAMGLDTPTGREATPPFKPPPTRGPASSDRNAPQLQGGPPAPESGGPQEAATPAVSSEHEPHSPLPPAPVMPYTTAQGPPSLVPPAPAAPTSGAHDGSSVPPAAAAAAAASAPDSAAAPDFAAAVEEPLAVGKDMQEFLEAFLASDTTEDDEEGPAPAAHAANAHQAQLDGNAAAERADNAQQGLAAMNDVQNNSAAQPATTVASDCVADAMFLPWEVVLHDQPLPLPQQQLSPSDAASYERDLAEALTLLPDLESLAQNLVMSVDDMFPFDLASFNM